MAYRTFQFNVAGGNSAPVIGAQPDLTLQEGQSLSLPILAADADGDRLTVTVKNLPPARASTPPRDFSPRPPATVNSHQIASIFESMPTLPTPSPSTHRHAVFLMILATLMWSIAGVVTRHLDVARGFEVTFWRSLFSAVALIVALRVTRGPAFLPGLMTARWPVWASSLSWATMFTAFMIALTLTTVANVLVTQAIGPLITAIFTRLFLRHRLPARTWAAIALGGVGIAWMFGHEATGGVSLTGSLIALFIPFAAATNWTLLQSTANARAADGAPSSDMLPAILIGALISAFITLPFAWPLQASLHDIALLALLGVLQLAIPCLLVVRLSRELPAAEIALLGLLELLFGVAWAWMGASEQPSLATLTGGSLVIAALILNEVLALRQKHKVLAAP
jgi:drug/metabolite transporter (DMT)-like permease